MAGSRKASPRAKPVVPEDRHQWLSFEDPDEDRTWMFDVTFLSSSWTCIYGHGCQGVLTGPAQHLEEGCCSYGAHFIDDDDVATVKRAAAALTKQQWQRKAKAKRGGIVGKDDDGARTTRVVDGACIFLNRPGFAGGVGCALHIGALEAGERPLDWKPDVCWQLPLRLEERTDEHGHVTSIVREWKRRDWGAGGHEFHWWCTDSPEAFRGHTPVYRYLEDELVEMVGRPVYELLVQELRASSKATTATPLPHPALRR